MKSIIDGKRGQKGVTNGVKMPIFYNNVYKTAYNGTKPGVIRKILFQATNRKIYLTILYNMYGSIGPKRSFGVLKRVKMHIFYNNVYKTPYSGHLIAGTL